MVIVRASDDDFANTMAKHSQARVFSVSFSCPFYCACEFKYSEASISLRRYITIYITSSDIKRTFNIQSKYRSPDGTRTTGSCSMRLRIQRCKSKDNNTNTNINTVDNEHSMFCTTLKCTF